MKPSQRRVSSAPMADQSTVNGIKFVRIMTSLNEITLPCQLDLCVRQCCAQSFIAHGNALFGSSSGHGIAPASVRVLTTPVKREACEEVTFITPSCLLAAAAPQRLGNPPPKHIIEKREPQKQLALPEAYLKYCVPARHFLLSPLPCGSDTVEMAWGQPTQQNL